MGSSSCRSGGGGGVMCSPVCCLALAAVHGRDPERHQPDPNPAWLRRGPVGARDDLFAVSVARDRTGRRELHVRRRWWIHGKCGYARGLVTCLFCLSTVVWRSVVVVVTHPAHYQEVVQYNNVIPHNVSEVVRFVLGCACSCLPASLPCASAWLS